MNVGTLKLFLEGCDDSDTVILQPSIGGAGVRMVSCHQNMGWQMGLSAWRRINPTRVENGVDCIVLCGNSLGDRIGPNWG